MCLVLLLLLLVVATPHASLRNKLFCPTVNPKFAQTNFSRSLSFSISLQDWPSSELVGLQKFKKRLKKAMQFYQLKLTLALAYSHTQSTKQAKRVALIPNSAKQYTKGASNRSQLNTARRPYVQWQIKWLDKNGQSGNV